MALVGKTNNKPYNEGAGRSKVALSFAIGLILGATGMWVVSGSTVFSPIITDPLSNSNADNTAITASTSLEYIVVVDQLAEDRVLIKEIALTDSGWAVVHEDAGGVPGNALGAQRFDKGIHNGVIDLLRNTEVNQGYYVLLYRDNGDREFDLETDNLVLDAGGSPVGDTFRAIRVDRKINY